MRTINVTRFKAECLSLLDHLEPEGLLVTRHGKPIARVVPFAPDTASLIGSMKGKIRIKGNILSTDSATLPRRQR